MKKSIDPSDNNTSIGKEKTELLFKIYSQAFTVHKHFRHFKKAILEDLTRKK